MVIVYLKNGEKAPNPDANYVRLDGEGPGSQVLRCFFGNTEVGVFRWEEVAGYTVTSVRVGSNDAWAARMENA